MAFSIDILKAIIANEVKAKREREEISSEVKVEYTIVDDLKHPQHICVYFSDASKLDVTIYRIPVKADEREGEGEGDDRD